MTGLLALAAALAWAAPAQARLHEPGYGGPIAGGTFGGVSLRPAPTGAQAAETRPAEVTGDTCHVLRERVVSETGEVVSRILRLCR